MRTSFKVHAALAGGLGGVTLLLAALTWLPGRLPLPSPRTLAAIDAAVLGPVLVAAIVRAITNGADRRNLWPAFRCLTHRVQLAAGVLLGTGVLLTVTSFMGEGNRHESGNRDGRSAYETARKHRETVPVGAEEYAELRERAQRGALAIPGTLIAAAAVSVLVCGELRRADVTIARLSAPPPPPR